jgi:hypothetical protein
MMTVYRRMTNKPDLAIPGNAAEFDRGGKSRRVTGIFDLTPDFPDNNAPNISQSSLLERRPRRWLLI